MWESKVNGLESKSCIIIIYLQSSPQHTCDQYNKPTLDDLDYGTIVVVYD